MKLNIVTSADRNLEGMCPSCKEYTTAGDSCCGAGAIVEGGKISDESAQQCVEFATVSVRLFSGLDESTAGVVKSVLFHAGLFNTVMFCDNTDNKWNINVHLPIESLPREKE